MPQITDIKQQKRSAERFSVYADGKYVFALTDMDLSASSLRVGQTISADEIADWQQHSLEAKAYSAALRQLSYRRRSERELRDYLHRKEYDADLIQASIERLTAAGLLDDEAFAAAWIADRQLLKPRSIKQLQVELMQKGISRDVITAALGKVSPEDQLTTLADLIERKRRQSQYADPQKLMAYLARQGYSYDQIKKALARLDAEI